MSQLQLRRTAKRPIAKPPTEHSTTATPKPKAPKRVGRTILILRRPTNRITVVLATGR